MRCIKCNVDLGETYTLCPLCGEKASNDEPHLKGFTVAPYPKTAEVAQIPKTKKPSYGLSFDRIKAFFNL